MGLVASLVRPQAYAPQDDYWYQPIGIQASSGVRVTADTAMKISAVWACVRVISESIASIPLMVYERGADGGRERATGYYLSRVLHDQPNRFQTALEFREMLTGHALLRGNGYAEIVSGRRGFADQLIPLHPDRVTPQQQDETGMWRDDTTLSANIIEKGPVRYKVQRRNGTEEVLNDEDVFHLRSLSAGGIKGMSVIEYARESFGLALATESYGARFFSQNATPGGILEHPGKLGDNAQKHLRESLMDKQAGLANAHKPLVLEEGMKWHQMSMTSEDAQFLETRQFQIADIARWFRVPLHMIQETEKSTSWGSGIESLSLAFVIYTLLPWARRWEQAISRDLIIEMDRYYAEHLFDALLRGDLKSRYEAYSSARNWGWLSTNDIRRMENLNPIENGDIYLQPLNMVEAGTPPPQPQPAPPRREPDARANGHYSLLLREAAARIVRKEIVAMTKAAKRCSNDTEMWRQAVDEFYGEHIEFVSRTLHIGYEKAEKYCYDQVAMLLQHGAGAMETWETERVNWLVGLVTGGIE